MRRKGEKNLDNRYQLKLEELQVCALEKKKK